MSKHPNYKSFLDELIKEVQDELDESNVTGNVDGYQTPFAFSGGRKKDKTKEKSNIDVTGYTKVKDIDESINEAEINPVKKVMNTIFKKNGIKKLQSHSTSVRGFRKTTGSGYEYQYGGSVSLINIPSNVVKDLANQMRTAGVKVKTVYGNGIDFNPKELDYDVISLNTESVNEALDPKANKFLDAIQVIDRDIKDLKHITVDATPQGNWSVYFKGKRMGTINGKMLDDRTIMKYGLEHMDEGVYEGKKPKGPVNRWLELKNDDTMHANKKLAVGLKELKYQLREVETFFRWYNQIKTMNELSSDGFWKRTHSHIYKIKERLINIAKTIQEIEK